MDDGMATTVKQILLDPVVGKVVAIFLGVATILLIASLLRRSARKRIVDDHNRYRASKMVTFGSYFTVVLLLTVVFSDELGGLTTAFGVAGAGVAFALQEVIASVAGWLAISAGGFFRTGDRVQLGGIKGDVIDISVLRTTVMELGVWVDGDLYNGRIVRIANSFVFKEPVYNYSADFPFLWDEIKIPIRYGSDLVRAEAILTEVAEEVVGAYGERAGEGWKDVAKTYLVEDARTGPMITLVATDNWCEYTLRYTVAYSRRRITKHLLFRALVQEIAKTDEAVQLASGTYEIVAAPRFDVRLDPHAEKAA